MNQSETILFKRNFALYCKKQALRFIKLQTYKRQLSYLLSNLQYVIPFAQMDLDHKGNINQKNLQHFLMKFGHFHKPLQINRYFLKYSHQKQTLHYEDILQALLPHSDYVSMAQKFKKQKYLCDRLQNKLILNTAAMIISNQISYMTLDYKQMCDITLNNYRVGAILWRLLNKNFSNHVGYQQIKFLFKQINVQIKESEWYAFLSWHFGSHRKYINRDQFIVVLNCHNQRKRATFSCRYDQFVVKKQIMKNCENEYNRKLCQQQKIKQKIKLIQKISKGQFKFSNQQQKQDNPQYNLSKNQNNKTHKSQILLSKKSRQLSKTVNNSQYDPIQRNKNKNNYNRSMSISNYNNNKNEQKYFSKATNHSSNNQNVKKSTNIIRKIVNQQHFNNGFIQKKQLLYTKLGYKNPSNLVKYSIQKTI